MNGAAPEQACDFRDIERSMARATGFFAPIMAAQRKNLLADKSATVPSIPMILMDEKECPPHNAGCIPGGTRASDVIWRAVIAGMGTATTTAIGCSWAGAPCPPLAAMVGSTVFGFALFGGMVEMTIEKRKYDDLNPPPRKKDPNGEDATNETDGSGRGRYHQPSPGDVGWPGGFGQGSGGNGGDSGGEPVLAGDPPSDTGADGDTPVDGNTVPGTTGTECEPGGEPGTGIGLWGGPSHVRCN